MNRLVFVNELGPNFRGDNLYEFIFSDNEDVSGEDWESSPAGGNPQPPHIDYITKVGVLKNDKIKLNVIQNSDFFSFYDAVDKVIALSWEDIENEYYNEEDTRLVFHYGDSEEEVMSKLYERDIILTFEKNLTHV
jgi:hypothetical protein